jgi:hypothetical protein
VDLPKPKVGPRTFGSDIWLKLPGTPAEWADRLLQVTVFAWDREKNAWDTAPIAISDRAVWGEGKLWQHNLILLAAADSPRERSWQTGKALLVPGRYLIKVHVDFKGRLKRDWNSELGESEYVGKAEIETRWPEGYGNMTVLAPAKLRR